MSDDNNKQDISRLYFVCLNTVLHLSKLSIRAGSDDQILRAGSLGNVKFSVENVNKCVVKVFYKVV